MTSKPTPSTVARTVTDAPAAPETVTPAPVVVSPIGAILDGIVEGVRSGKSDAATEIARLTEDNDGKRAIGRIAYASTLTDAALADAVSRARVLLKSPESTWHAPKSKPEQTYAEFVNDVSSESLKISDKTIGNYRNAWKVIDRSGIDQADSTAFGHALTLVSSGKADAIKLAASIKSETDPAASLAARAADRLGAAAAARKASRAASADKRAANDKRTIADDISDALKSIRAIESESERLAALTTFEGTLSAALTMVKSDVSALTVTVAAGK